MDDTPGRGTRVEQLRVLLSDAPKPDDHDKMREYLHGLAALGCAPLLVMPGTKLPFDGRTAGQRRADDKAAQLAAHDAGRPDWRTKRSRKGVYLATDDPAVLDGYVSEYARTFGHGFPINVAVSVGRSRLVVVDCDTAEQLKAFLVDADEPDDTPPTVRTPGQLGPDGQTMVHSGGGHFWFTVPEAVELPACVESMTDPEGEYAVIWGAGRYVLIPPSVRAEGRYEVPEGGAVHELPSWLADRIIAHGQVRAERAARSCGVADRDGPITRWGASVTWAQILADAAGWVNTGKPDGCGCEIWTAPGAHGCEKSATAHEPGCSCSVFVDSPDPPLHIWTDHDFEPFGQMIIEYGPTLTRLRAVAAIHYDNDTGTAMDALELHDEPTTLGVGQVNNDSPDRGTADDISENLPESFWAARPALTHIRQAAHRGVNSADAVLGAVLARLAASLDPCVTVDTGVKQPMPLSMFVGLVGSAGTGKSSAHAAAARLVAFDRPALMTPGLVTNAHEMPLELPVGSGPGLAEAFMGAVIDPANLKAKPTRRQVSHKLLLHSDEGAGLVAGILDNKRGQDIGPALRTAWTGAVLGQANASAERKRQVRDYVLGLCVGFQLEALAALSTPEQLEYGTPQRFLYVSATDPAIPDDAPEDPGPLTVALPCSGLRYSNELAARARTEALQRTRGHAGDGGANFDPMNAHRPAMLARLAALLVVLCDPGRSVIDIPDVELATTLLDCSARLHDKAVAWRREREASEADRKTAARINEQVATAVAVDGRDAALAALEQDIMRRLDEAGGTAVWTGRAGLRQKFKSDKRGLADVALDRLVNNGTLTREGDLLTRS